MSSFNYVLTKRSNQSLVSVVVIKGILRFLKIIAHFGELQILELFALGDAYLALPKPVPKIWLSHTSVVGVNC